MKKCIKCELELDDNLFYNRRNVCKKCISEYRKNWVKNNKDVMSNHSKNWRNKNLEKSKKTQKNWYDTNKEEVKKKRKSYVDENYDRVKETWKRYREKNKEKLKSDREEYVKNNRDKINLYSVNRRNSSSILKIIHNSRSRIRSIIKSKNGLKKDKTLSIIGCTYDELMTHIEQQFTEGMNWENYGYYGWHIDHIIPLSLAETVDDVYKLCHYSNLQPIWWKDNLIKSNKYEKK